MYKPKRLRGHFRIVKNRLVPKSPYDTLEEAENADINYEGNAYLCNFCNKYHTGRISEKRKKV